MLRVAPWFSMFLIACGGASPPPPREASAPAPAAATAEAAPAPKAEAPDRAYQEALLCLEDCESTEEGEMDAVEDLCRERCDLEPRHSDER